MIRQSDEEAIMRSYLLGDLDEARQEQVEERVLCDAAFADRLAAAQDNLIDDFVFNVLCESERESFQKNFVLNDERRNKLLIAHAFEEYVENAPERRRAIINDPRLASGLWRNILLLLQRHKLWVTFSLTAALLLLFLLAPKITRQLLPNKSAPPFVEQRASIERQIAELNRHPSLAANQATLELTLQPTLLREGGEIRKILLTAELEFVSLKLEIPRGRRYEVYDAMVRTVDGGELFAVSDLKAMDGTDSGLILLRIPSEFLPKADYQIELRGTVAGAPPVEIARFDFRVINNIVRR